MLLLTGQFSVFYWLTWCDLPLIFDAKGVCR
jgi:hypothetical protein